MSRRARIVKKLAARKINRLDESLMRYLAHEASRTIPERPAFIPYTPTISYR